MALLLGLLAAASPLRPTTAPVTLGRHGGVNRGAGAAATATASCSAEPPQLPGLRLRTRRTAVIFDYNESIGSAHGDAFALRSGVLQTTVHVNRKSEYYRKLLPLNDTVGRRCGGPHDSGAPLRVRLLLRAHARQAQHIADQREKILILQAVLHADGYRVSQTQSGTMVLQ